MSNGDDVLDNWEEIDEAGLESKLDKLKRDRQEPSKHQLEQHLQQEYQEQSISDTAMSFQNSIPMMMVMQQTENEYKSSNYTTQAMPAVKILRRPAQQNSGLNRDNGLRPKQPIKTLQQREQEYAEARLRILGSAKNPEDEMETLAATSSIVPKVNPKSPADIPNVVCSQPSPQPPQALTVIQLNSRTSLPSPRPPPTMMNNSISTTGIVVGVGGGGGGGGGGNVGTSFFPPTSSMMVGGVNMRYNESVLRMPKGPDGTSGFQMRR